jgi:hypothetical protein
MSQETLGRFIFMIASSKNTKLFGRACFFTYLLSDDFTFWQQIKIFIKIDKRMMGTTQSGGINMKTHTPHIISYNLYIGYENLSLKFTLFP